LVFTTQQQPELLQAITFPGPPGPDVIPPAPPVTPTTVPGPSDSIWDADEQRRRWLEWSLKRKLAKKGQKAPIQAPALEVLIVPEPDSIATEADPDPAKKTVVIPHVSLDTLLAANAAAVRAQQESAMVQAAAERARAQLAKKLADDEDDDDAALFLLDD
jgi:hypothetical protein